MSEAILSTDPTCDGIDQLLEMAQSANVFFEIVSDHLIIRAVNPKWDMWKPIRHFLDEIGQPRIEAYIRAKATHGSSLAT